MSAPARSLRAALREQHAPPFDRERTWGAVRSRYVRRRHIRRGALASMALALAAAVLFVVTLREPISPAVARSAVTFDSSLVRRVFDLETALTPFLAGRDAAFRRQFTSDLQLLHAVISELETYRPAAAGETGLLVDKHSRALNAKARLLRSIVEAD